MATCPQCGTVHMPSARTCRKCGADLSPHNSPVAPALDQVLQETLAEPPAELEEPTLTLVVIGSGISLGLQSKDQYVLGRTDPERGIYVDVDMSDYGGIEAGVSRRHARIFKQQGQFYIEDLRSANGTYLNEMRLEPGLAHLLHTGDLIKLGVLRIYVEIE